MRLVKGVMLAVGFEYSQTGTTSPSLDLSLTVAHRTGYKPLSYCSSTIPETHMVDRTVPYKLSSCIHMCAMV